MISPSKIEPSVKVPDALEPLPSLLAVIDEAKSLTDFFSILLENIIPILLSNPSLGLKRALWEQEKQNHYQALESTEKQLRRQVQKTYNTILERVGKVKFNKKQDCLIQQFLKEIDDLIQGKEIYGTPSEYEVAHDQISRLMTLLIEFGQTKLICDLVELSPLGGMLRLTVIPAMLKLIKLRSIWSWDICPPAWVIWSYFYDAHWAWNVKASFFRKHKIADQTPYQRRKMMKLYELHDCWCELQSIKNRSFQPSSNAFYTKERFAKYLNVLIRDIVTFLGTEKPELYTKQDKKPLAYSIHLHSDELWFIIHWEGRRKEHFCIKRFNIYRARSQIEGFR